MIIQILNLRNIYILFCFSLSNLMSKILYKSCICSFHSSSYHLIKNRDLLRWVAFISFRRCSFDYFSMIRSRRMKICYHFILLYIPTEFGGYGVLGSCAITFQGIIRDNVTYRNYIWEYKKRVTRDIWEWYQFICTYIPTKSGDCSLGESCV